MVAIKPDFSEDRGAILEVYSRSLAEFGNTPRGITWGSVLSQEARFKVLSEIADLDGKTLLDVGCGFGDLWGYFVEKNILLSGYTGIDINPQVLAEAGRRWPSGPEFLLLDLAEDELDGGPFDYVVESGALGIATPNWQEYTRKILMSMWDLCREGMAVNFLTWYSSTETGSHYIDPGEMLDYFCKNMTTRVVFRQDYKDNDCTFYLFR